MSSDKKGGLWGAIRSVIVEDVPEPEPARAPAPSPVPVRDLPPAAVHPDHPSLAPVKAVVDQAARQRLEQAIASDAPPGYSEIVDMISTLAESIPDEGSRYRAALKLAAKHGHTVQDLLGDMDKCIGILEGKGRDFQEETKSQVARKVGARQKAVQDMDALIKSKQEQIQSIQQEIAQLSEKRGTEAAAITSETAKIQAVTESFEAVYDAVMDKLVDTRKKIEAYGKAV